MTPLLITVALGLFAGVPAPESGEARVLIISVDGLRSDLLLLADTPRMEELYRNGAFSFWARTTPAGVTLPSHATMLTGVRIEKHGITWNGNETPRDVRSPHPKVPTIFEIARSAGISSAFVVGKAKLWQLLRPESANWTSIPEETLVDEVVVGNAIEILEAHDPRLFFLHLPGVDSVGHDHGWGSREQFAAIEEADRWIGAVLDVLARKGALRSTLVILTADHGGFLKSHDGDDARGRRIPWVAFGPGVKRMFDLAGHLERTIETEDTFATACRFLGIPTPDWIDGRAVDEAFVRSEEPAAKD